MDTSGLDAVSPFTNLMAVTIRTESLPDISRVVKVAGLTANPCMTEAAADLDF